MLTLAYTWTEEFGKSIVFAVALMLLFTIAFRGKYFSKLLSNQWVAVVGGMCYTIYLTHLPLLEMQMIFTKNLSLTNHYLPNLLVQLAIGVPLVLATSAVFFLVLEKPFMKREPLPSVREIWAKLASLKPLLAKRAAPATSFKKALTIALLFMATSSLPKRRPARHGGPVAPLGHTDKTGP